MLSEADVLSFAYSVGTGVDSILGRIHLGSIKPKIIWGTLGGTKPCKSALMRLAKSQGLVLSKITSAVYTFLSDSIKPAMAVEGMAVGGTWPHSEIKCPKLRVALGNSYPLSRKMAINASVMAADTAPCTVVPRVLA